MKFSVVIPLFNKRNNIKRTIESVLSQDFHDYEIILVDDGSTDDSLQVAKTIASDKLHIIEQKNQGVAVARNTGVQNASGEYIAFLDADDIWHKDYLQTIDSLIGQFQQCDIFVTAYRILMGNGKNHKSAHLSHTVTVLPSYWCTYRYAYDIVWTSATVIRKSSIISAGMFTPGEKIGQDLDLWARVARNNPLVAYSPNRCVDYNRNAEQNARTRIRIAYPKAFLNVLENEMLSHRWTQEDKKWMQNKYNKKMTVYVFTTILAGKGKDARKILRSWSKKYSSKFIPFLYIASYMPLYINRKAYDIRMQVF